MLLFSDITSHKLSYCIITTCRSTDSVQELENKNDTIRTFQNSLYYNKTTSPHVNDKTGNNPVQPYEVPVSRHGQTDMTINGNKALSTTGQEITMQVKGQITDHRHAPQPCKTSGDRMDECSYINLNHVSRSKASEIEEHIYHILEPPTTEHPPHSRY